jgi:hypothetical protein
MTISRTLQDPYGGVEKLHHKHRPDDRVFVEHNCVFHRGKIESGDGTHYHVKLDSGHEIVAHELELTPEDWPAGEKPAAEHAEVVRVQKATAEGKSIAAGIDPTPVDVPLMKAAGAKTSHAFTPGQKVKDTYSELYLTMSDA